MSTAMVIYHGEHVNLETLATKFGMCPKTVPYTRIDGIHSGAMDAALIEEIGQGAARDCEITLQLFRTLRENFPSEEPSKCTQTHA
jgi:hypothetical protein